MQKKREIEKSIETFYNLNYLQLRREVKSTGGIIKFAKKEIQNLSRKDTSYETKVSLLENYNQIETREKDIKQAINIVLVWSVIILISSMLSLFGIGYSKKLDKIIFSFGIFLIAQSLLYFSVILRLITIILDIKLPTLFDKIVNRVYLVSQNPLDSLLLLFRKNRE